MTATTTDREATRYDEGLVAYPVAAATTIYLGSAVAVTAAGYAVSLTDSAAVKFVGIASEGVINTAAEGYGAAGDLNIKVHTRGIHAMVSASLAITDQGCDLYWADNQTVQKTPTTVYAGKLARYTSATEALVDIGPALVESEGRGRFFVLQAMRAGAIGAGPHTLLDGYEHPVQFIIRRAFLDLGTAPGGTDDCVLTTTQGSTTDTVTATGADVHAEKLDYDLGPMDADTDLDVTIADSGLGADAIITLVCEEL